MCKDCLKLIYILCFLIILVVALSGCGQSVLNTNYEPEKTNQTLKLLGEKINNSLATSISRNEKLIQGGWIGINSQGKNCFFAFREDNTYEFIIFSDYNIGKMSVHEKGIYYLLSENEIVFSSSQGTYLDNKISFSIDDQRRKITLYEGTEDKYNNKYEVYSTQYYAIF